jgi:hypothetical protein
MRRVSKIALSTLLLVLALGSSAQAAVTFDCKMESGAGSQASPFSYVSNAATVACTPAATSNRVLIGFVALRAVVSSSVTMTWNSVSMTPIGSISNTAGGSYDLYLFGLINPASGAQTLSVSWSGGTAGVVVLGGFMLSGADQTTGWQNFASNSATSTAMTSGAITSANGNLVVAATADNDASSASISAGTSDWDERSFQGNYEGGHIASSGASATVSWTLGSSVAWAVTAVDVIAFSGGGAAPKRLLLLGCCEVSP